MAKIDVSPAIMADNDIDIPVDQTGLWQYLSEHGYVELRLSGIKNYLRDTFNFDDNAVLNGEAINTLTLIYNAYTASIMHPIWIQELSNGNKRTEH